MFCVTYRAQHGLSLLSAPVLPGPGASHLGDAFPLYRSALKDYRNVVLATAKQHVHR